MLLNCDNLVISLKNADEKRDRMNPRKVNRKSLSKLTDLPNVGEVIAADLRRIGIERPAQLEGRDPYELYLQLCEATGTRHDPCMLDVLMSIADFMGGAAPREWWAYTAERKRRYQP